MEAGANNTTIGQAATTPAAAERNVISGNNGWAIDAGPVSGLVIEGNFVGLAADGDTALPNLIGGIRTTDAASPRIGGTSAGAGNYVSGNGSASGIAGEGIHIVGPAGGATIQGNRIGLIVFSGTAFVQCPLTLDYGASKIFLDTVATGVVPEPGTDILQALEAASRGFVARDSKFKVVVLLTDGEDEITFGFAKIKFKVSEVVIEGGQLKSVRLKVQACVGGLCRTVFNDKISFGYKVQVVDGVRRTEVSYTYASDTKDAK